MQAEQVAGLHHQRADLIKPAAVAMELIIERLAGRGGPSEINCSRRPTIRRFGGSNIRALRGSTSSNSTQATGSRPVILHRDHHGDRVADLGRPAIALPLGREIVDPDPRQQPADQHHPQQGVHGIGQQAQAQQQRHDQQQAGPQEPFHGQVGSTSGIGNADIGDQLVDDRLGRDLAAAGSRAARSADGPRRAAPPA